MFIPKPCSNHKTDAAMESKSSDLGAALRELVEIFYESVWNARDDTALFRILAPDLRFHGSTEAVDRIGPEAFKAYRDSIHQALHSYTCNIEDIVVDGAVAFARAA